MARELTIETLEGAARHYANQLMGEDRKGRSGAFIAGPSYVKQDFSNFHFSDEFDFLVNGVKEWLGPKAINLFEVMLADLRPRTEKEHVEQLKKRLAIDPNGNHIEGAIGIVEVGVRPIMQVMEPAETRSSILRRIERGLPIHDPSRTDRETYMKLVTKRWPVYAGEAEERIAGRESPIGMPGADELPEGAFLTDPYGNLARAVGANVTNLSEETARAALDGMRVSLDEGTTAATIRGRTGAQPADPDAAETGTLLFTLTCSDPAVLAAADDADGTVSATFDTITDDTSADATNTLSYCRFGATGTGADDHIDGNATTDATGATDWNTLSIVSGSTVSMTSAVINLSQGSTAT